MTRVCFVLLCHKSPDAVIAQVRLLTGSGDAVAIHVDRNAPPAMEPALRQALDGNPAVTFARRVRCGWGQWSLVQASLNGLTAGLVAFPDASHFYLVSGDCFPVKSALAIRARLASEPRDWIELNDFHDSGWIKVGLKEERLIYRHWFNERQQKTLFYTALAVQQRLGLRRRLPDGLRIMIGSQWWCLRRSTVTALFDFIARRRAIARFFRSTWIPDETFFQTLVHHLVPRREIVARAPTFLLFSDYGMPVNFHDDHADILVRQDCFFARKLSPRATGLKARLADLYLSADSAQGQDTGARRYFQYVTSRGRAGQRHAPRIWDDRARLGTQRRVVLIVGKKWHVAKRYAQALADLAGMIAYGYIFSETEAGLPPMGGLGATLDNRQRHRLALLRALADVADGPALALCLDPAHLDTVRDLAADGCDLRVLEIRGTFSDSYLAGHAERMGIGIGHLQPQSQDELIATLRGNIEQEHRDLHRLNLPVLATIDEHAELAEVADALGRVAGLDAETGLRCAHRARFGQMGSAHVQL